MDVFPKDWFFGPKSKYNIIGFQPTITYNSIHYGNYDVFTCLDCRRVSDGQTNGQTDGQTDGQPDGFVSRITVSYIGPAYNYCKVAER